MRFSFLFHPYSQSESSLHSLFLWPQSCTCLLRADPGTERGTSMLGSISPAFRPLCVGHMREKHKSKGDKREQEREEGEGSVTEGAPADDSPYRSPSDWLPPPSPLGETRPWRPAAACWGDWTTWTTAEICRRNINRKALGHFVLGNPHEEKLRGAEAASPGSGRVHVQDQLS